jgi:hypothetical protein
VTQTELVLDHRFNGPAGSGNGGVTSGLLAERFDPAATVEVTLRLPPPLQTPITIVQDGLSLQALAGTELIATAAVVGDELVPEPPVELSAAVAAMTRYDGLVDHPFATCFVCGTGRPAGDGLEIWAGSVTAGEPKLVASKFVARNVGLPGPVLVWAALDCPGGWSIGLVGRRAVLGRMTARVVSTPLTDEVCVVVASCLGWQGRKAFSRSSLYGADGRLLGVAAQTWIELR